MKIKEREGGREREGESVPVRMGWGAAACVGGGRERPETNASNSANEASMSSMAMWVVCLSVFLFLSLRSAKNENG
jgi:hypothetical protein